MGQYVDNDVSTSKARGASTVLGRRPTNADADVAVMASVDLDRLLRSTRDLTAISRIVDDLAVLGGPGCAQSRQSKKLETSKTRTDGTLSKLREDDERLNREIRQRI